MDIDPPTRRERLRLQTLQEIREQALAQIADGGAAAMSLNAIAKALGMSGPAIYRYFASRDELLAALVTEGYAELAAALDTAAAQAVRRAPARRLDAVAGAYRAWALAHPHRYAMLFGVRPAGFTDTDAAIEIVHEGMRVLLRTLDAVAGDGSAGAGPGERGDRLDAQLRGWAARHHDGQPPHGPRTLRLGVLTWTRLHGIVSLELAGVFADMELDAELLLRAELRQVVAAATT